MYKGIKRFYSNIILKEMIEWKLKNFFMRLFTIFDKHVIKSIMLRNVHSLKQDFLYH